MKVTEGSGAELHWITKDHNKEKWFECKLNLIDFSIEKTTDKEKAKFIQTLIKSAAELNSDFLSQWKKYRVAAQLEFDPDWGWGSSSTLIANIAHWAELSPFELYFETQTGSGYDIAAALSSGPFLYQKNENELSFETFDADPALWENTYVFYQGQKSDSADAVSKWRKGNKWKSKDIEQITQISETIAEGCNIGEAIEAFRDHENLLSTLLGQPPLQKYFPGFDKGIIKSLGAWGGDFALALHPDPEFTPQYLKEKKIDTFFRLKDIILS